MDGLAVARHYSADFSVLPCPCGCRILVLPAGQPAQGTDGAYRKQ